MKTLKAILFVAAVCGFVFGLTGQTLPAPTVDRIGFPKDYQKLPVLYVFDRPDNKQVRTVFANDVAFGVKTGQQGAYPYGSIIVMETWRALQDAQGIPIVDQEGRFQKDPAATPTVFVMRKEKGFGVDYKEIRNGEWEYVAYRPDGSYQTTPANSGGCANCHLLATQAKDWVFRAALHFNGGSGAVPDAIIKGYKFVPGTLRVKAGSTITVYNDDVIEHTITDDFPGGGDTGRLKGGNSFSINFTVPGEFNFHCTIHPTMKGKIIVE